MDDLFGEEAWGEEPDWARTGEEKEEAADGAATATDETGAPRRTLGAQHVLLLVDCHGDMFRRDRRRPLQQERPIDLALGMANTLLRKRIRETVTLKTGKRNGVGVLLYHTKPLEKNKKEDDEEEEEDDDDGASAASSDDETDDGRDSSRDVHVLIPLHPPGVTEARTLRECANGDRDIEDEFARPPDDDDDDDDDSGRIPPLQTALEEAIRVFREASCVRKPTTHDPTPDARSIWILTNRARPYSPEAREYTANVARDARELGIRITLWPLAHHDENDDDDDDDAGGSFCSDDAFYGPIVSHPPFFKRRLSTPEELEEGLASLRQEWKKTRRLYWGPLHLPGASTENDGPPPGIMVDWFRFVQIAKKPNKVAIDQHSKKETIKIKQYLDHNHEIFASFRPGDADDRKAPKGGLQRLRQFVNFGGEQIPISPADVEDLRFAANGRRREACLSLLGFKPLDSLPEHHSMDAPYLLVPNDETVRGSKEAFWELHAAMLRKKVLAIGEVLHRVHWSSRLVAIYPLEATESSSPLRGMVVVTLPFEDDLRQLEEDEAWRRAADEAAAAAVCGETIPSAHLPDETPSLVSSASLDHPVDPPGILSEALCRAAVDLVSHQCLPGKELGTDFENAALTEFFDYLESVALELPDDPNTARRFDTRPDEAEASKALGDKIETFRGCLPEDLGPPSRAGARKRKKELPADDSGLDWQDLLVSDSIRELKVPQLKSYLRSVGAPLSGAKAILVQRVTKLLEEAAANAGKVKPEKP